MCATSFFLGRGTIGVETEDDGVFGRREVGYSKSWKGLLLESLILAQ